MSWNYRIIKKDTDEPYYYLAEVYYQKDKSLMAHTDEVNVTGESQKEIMDVLKMMLKDASLPVINEKDFYTKKLKAKK